jgi:anionic cell wall polymer biosynthesis LytR-Cps2A-Psr (LCP) family protein
MNVKQSSPHGAAIRKLIGIISIVAVTAAWMCVSPAQAAGPDTGLQPVPLAQATATPGAAAAQPITNTVAPTANTPAITPTIVISLDVAPGPVAPVRLPVGTVNVALLGIDTRPQGGSKNSDVIIIASMQPDVPAITLLSIPRDTLVWIPSRNQFGKINTAYAYGGFDSFKQMMKYNLGLNIDSFVAVNFSALVNTVNTFGGIDIVANCPLYQVFPKDPYYFADEATPLVVTQPYTDTFSGEVWQPGQAVPTQTIYIPGPGVYGLNGLQTLAFARARYGVPGGDIDRGHRTQQVVRGLFNKAKSDWLGTLAKLPRLTNQIGRNVQTSLTPEQIVTLTGLAEKFDDTTIRSRFFEGVGLTGATLPEVGSVLIPNRDNISWYVQQALNVPQNQQAGNAIPVDFVNGTGNKDMGIVAAGRLRDLGFNVVKTEESAKVLTETQVIDYTTTDKGSALPRILRELYVKPANVIKQPNANGPRYRIIAGRDFNPCYQKTLAVGSAPQATATRANPVANATPAATPEPPLVEITAVPDPNQPAAQPTPTLTQVPALDPGQAAQPTLTPVPELLVEPTPEG